jgi:acyl-CoA thioesterase-1
MRYIALGDSSGVGIGAHDGRGYVERLADRLRQTGPVELTNLCVSGATSPDVLARQVPRLRTAEPGLVTLLVGVNDLWRLGEPRRFARAFADIAAGMESSWKTPPAIVAVASLPDMSLAPAAAFVQRQFGIPPSAIAERIHSYNAYIRRVVLDRGWSLVDLGRETVAGRGDLFSADGFHPSAAGYQRIAEVFYEVVGPALAQRRAG